MRSLFFRGMAIALSGWALTGDAHAQYSPYGTASPYGAPSGPELYPSSGTAAYGPAAATNSYASPMYAPPTYAGATSSTPTAPTSPYGGSPSVAPAYGATGSQVAPYNPSYAGWLGRTSHNYYTGSQPGPTTGMGQPQGPVGSGIAAPNYAQPPASSYEIPAYAGTANGNGLMTNGPQGLVTDNPRSVPAASQGYGRTSQDPIGRPHWFTGLRMQGESGTGQDLQPAATGESLYGPPPAASPSDVPLQSGPMQGPPSNPWATYGDGSADAYGAAGYGMGGCGTGGCGTCAPLGSPWFGGVYGLIMNRDHENDVWLSYDTNNVRNRVITTRDASMDWSGGVEARLGRYLDGGNYAVEGIYWGVFPRVSSKTVTANEVSGGLNTILHLDELMYDPGTGDQPVSDFFLNAESHRLLRSYQFHNLELNLLKCCTQPCARGVRFGWLAGIRYFRFDEGFAYSTDPNDTVFNGDPEELTYMVNVVNHLVGGQVGGRIDYCLWNRFSVFADTKVGLYNNRIRHRSQLSGSVADAFVSDPGGPYDGELLCITSRKNDVAMIGELNLGGTYQLTRCWSISGGYRAVAFSGLALATNQIPVDYLSAIDSVRRVDSNGSMILHGAYAGLQYNY